MQTGNLAPSPGASAISIATMLLLNNPERNGKPKACATGTTGRDETPKYSLAGGNIARCQLGDDFLFRRVGAAPKVLFFTVEPRPYFRDPAAAAKKMHARRLNHNAQSLL
jgi:hypothetical protein